MQGEVMIMAVCAVSQVSWEFWTNSNDECGLLCDKQKKFIKVTTKAALQLPLSSTVQGAAMSGTLLQSNLLEAAEIATSL